MPQNVGSAAITGTTFNTLIPILSETADITEALRLYHFGASTTDYNIANTNPVNLPNPGIAYTLYDLQDQITTLSGNVGIAYSEYAAKGDILTTTGPGNVSTVQPLALGSQGQTLTVNTATATGLEWQTPYAAPTIGSTAIPSATTVTTIAGLTLTNPTLNAGSGVLVLPGSNTPAQTADGSIVWDLDSDLLTVGTGSGRKTMVDTDSTQTLTNKTLSNPTITNDLYLFDNNRIIFEGSSGDTNETILTVANPTADRTVTIPDATGDVVLNTAAQTLTNKAISGGTFSDGVVRGLEEDVNVVALAAEETINFDVATASIWYYTSPADDDHVLNFRYSSGVSLNSAMAIGDSITLVWIYQGGNDNEAYPDQIRIDGTIVTPKVPSPITGGFNNAINVFVFTIIKTANATFTVLETQTKFA
jgi:hypothetical protein